jgi:glycosyltransferase involved in cell wall biosynthesis
MKIPIVIAAYNRDHTLTRLLSSLAKAHYSEPVKLIISIDGGGPESVKTVARDFSWQFGPKEIIEHPENMGLRRHILFCGGLSQQYDGIVLLEDDLYVSPWFYDYTISALKFYEDCPSVCGVSLYSYRYNETSLLPFIPLNDGSHTYFMQVPCSWGQAWLKEHWSAFENWYVDHCDLDYNDDPALPPNIVSWPATSWKKYFFKYMVELGKFFVYPAGSYTTNFGDKGQHHQGSHLYQVPLMVGKAATYVFKRFEQSLIKYDAWSELIPECLNELADSAIDCDFSVDLHGTKGRESLSGEYVLTSKQCKSYLTSFGRSMLPVEMNIINQISGSDIYLARTDQLVDYGNINDYIFERATDIQNQQYYCTTDSFHYSLLHRAQNKVNDLYQQGQIIESAYRESTRLLESFYASLSWRITAPLRKLLDLVRR